MNRAKLAGIPQVGAVALALVVVLTAGAYGTTRGLLSDEPPPTWGRQEIINTVLNYIRVDPCNHPNDSTAKATRTTMDGAAEILAKRWDPYGVERGQTADNTPVWLVEVQGEIPVIGGNRGVTECEEPRSGANSLVFYLVTIDGKVTKGFARTAP